MDLVDSIKRHAVDGFVTKRPLVEHIFHKDYGLIEALQEAQRASQKRFREGRGLEWTKDDHRLHNTIVPHLLRPVTPKWVRRELVVPRCTNTISIYLFFLVDLIFWAAMLYPIRALSLRLWDNSHLKEKDPKEYARQEKKRERVVYGSTVVLATVLTTMSFKVIRKYADWVDEPHLILTALLSFYLLIGSSLT